MPRVAVLFEYPSLLGGERSLLAAAERLTGSFEFVALAPSTGPLADALHDAGIATAPSPLFDRTGNRLPRPLAISQTIDAVREIHPDLLHANSLSMGRLTGAAASRLGVPCTAHLRDIIGLSAAAVSDLNGNTRLIAVSEATRAFHVGQGLDPAKTVVVRNGINLDRFRPQPRPERIRSELDIPSDALVVLTVGQIGLRKGWDVLAEAAARIAERFPSLHVVLAGERYSDKPETVAYEQSVREWFAAAMPGRTHFVGYRPDMPDLMAAADLLVHPARQEPFGRVLLEAAASGLPVVATTAGGTKEMLEDGVSARLIPPGDPDALATAMSESLNNPGLRRRFAAAAQQRIEGEFSAGASADRLAAVWKSLLPPYASV